MKDLIKLLLKTSVELEISPEAALHLYAKRYKVMFPIHPQEIGVLTAKGYLVQGSLDDSMKGILAGLEKSNGKRTNTKSEKRPYRFVYEHLKSKVLPVKLSGSTQASLDKFMPIEGEFKEYFKVFLFMFPSSSIEQNAHWIRYYGVRYSGYKLRVVSQSAVTNFTKICRAYDPDILLLATHKMITDSVRKDENKAFVMKISNFMAEWYDRYTESKELLEKKGNKVFSTVDRNISSSENTILI